MRKRWVGGVVSTENGDFRKRLRKWSEIWTRIPVDVALKAFLKAPVFGGNDSTHSSFTCGRKAKTDKKCMRFRRKTHTRGRGLNQARIALPIVTASVEFKHNYCGRIEFLMYIFRPSPFPTRTKASTFLKRFGWNSSCQFNSTITAFAIPWVDIILNVRKCSWWL